MELSDFTEAAAAALAELGEATPDVPPTALPADSGQAESRAGQAEDAPVAEQPSAESDVEEFDFGFDEDESGPPAEQGSDDILDQVNWDEVEWELPGVEQPVSQQELWDGYLRQADYTKKTQEVAEQRKANEKAIRLWEALQANPLDVVKALAAEAGLIDPNGEPVQQIDFSPIRTAEQVEAEVQARVQAELAQHPALLEAETQRALAIVDSEFARIEQIHGVKLSQNARTHILRVAGQQQVADLELVYRAERARQESLTQARAEAKAASPTRPTGNRQVTETQAPADSFEAAAQRALIEMGVG